MLFVGFKCVLEPVERVNYTVSVCSFIERPVLLAVVPFHLYHCSDDMLALLHTLAEMGVGCVVGLLPENSLS